MKATIDTAVLTILATINQGINPRATDLIDSERELYLCDHKLKYKSTQIVTITDEEFEMLKDFFLFDVSTITLCHGTQGVFKRNRITKIWQLFDTDWKYFPDKDLQVLYFLTDLEKAINFILEYRICFTNTQKAILVCH